MAVMRFDPFADSDIDRLFDRIISGGGARRSTSMPMDVYRRGNEYIVEMELPGVAEGDIDLQIDRNTLSVTAERPAQHGGEDEQIVCERPHLQVSRQLYLGEDVASDEVQAQYERGVLTVRIPIAQERHARRIQVGGGGRQQAIDVDSTERTSGDADRSGSSRADQQR